MIKGFIKTNGEIVPAITAKQMKEIDRIAVEETGPNLFQMMENAGRNLAELTVVILGEKWKQQKIIVLAGTGGNGGGGLCAARHLSNRGANVCVCITDPDKLKEVSSYQLRLLKSTGTKIIETKNIKRYKPDFIIDALLGYSLTGQPAGKVLELIQWAEDQACKKISLDVPSGVNATNGDRSDNFIWPDFTLTLALPKTGLLPEIVGELYLGDIGISNKTYSKLKIQIEAPIFNDKFVIPISAPSIM